MPDYYLTFLYNPLAPRNFTVFVWESNVKYVISVRQLFWKKLWIVNQSFRPARRNHCSQGTLLRILLKKFECSTCARTWLFEIFYTFVCKNFSFCRLKLGKVADKIIYGKSKASNWRNWTTGIEPKIWVA